ncbi:MAG: prepilin-type N-terminal cleavage/methylation domain-containing protein [Syntrophales bacterium]|nr:prepilin-type N-terminal cleavage/methylation domain-containing protein [Syntrophales bacterium]MDY0044588.1 prepilin-type N-terminal cleavage/methylation domain-containing protein [Syntrophales bacterium]
MNISDSSQGFTLIETVIALFVLAVGLFSAAGVATTVIHGNAIGREITTATTLAKDKMEELTYKNAVNGNDSIQSFFTRTWQVAADTPAPDMKTIDVTVTFPWKNSMKTVALRKIEAK